MAAPTPTELQQLVAVGEESVRAWWRRVIPGVSDWLGLWHATERLGRWAAARSEPAPEWIRLIQETLPDASAAWLSVGPASHTRESAVGATPTHGKNAHAWARRQFRPATQPLPDWVRLPAALAREVWAGLPVAERKQVAERLDNLVDPDGTVVGRVHEWLTDRPPGAPPVPPLMQFLRDAGSSEPFSAAGGRLTLFAAPILRRYPLLAPLAPAVDSTPDPSLDGADWVSEAFLAVRRGERERAERLIAQVDSALEAASGAGWYAGCLLRAELALADGEDAKARQWLGRATQMAPKIADAWLALVHLDRHAGRLHAARDTFERVPPRAASNALRALRGATLYLLGDSDEAARFGWTPTPSEDALAATDRRFATWAGALARAATGAATGVAPSDGGDRATSEAVVLWLAGHREQAWARLAERVASGAGSEHEVLYLAQWCDDWPRSEALRWPAGLDAGALAQQCAIASGTALPGARGARAARAAGWVQSLWERSGDRSQARRARAVRREVLDRSLEAGLTGEVLLAALLATCADFARDGRVDVWQERRAIAWSLWERTPWREQATRAAMDLYDALREQSTAEAKTEAEAVKARLDELGPDSGEEWEIWPEEARQMAWSWLSHSRPAEELWADPRFEHAAERRLALAKLDGLPALPRLGSLLRKPMMSPLRATAVDAVVEFWLVDRSADARELLEREAHHPLDAESLAAAAAALCRCADALLVEPAAEAALRWIRQADDRGGSLTIAQVQQLARLVGHAAVCTAVGAGVAEPAAPLSTARRVVRAAPSGVVEIPPLAAYVSDWAWAQAHVTAARIAAARIAAGRDAAGLWPERRWSAAPARWSSPPPSFTDCAALLEDRLAWQAETGSGR